MSTSTPNEKPIISSGGSAMAVPPRSANPILRRMSEDILGRSKAGDTDGERFSLGNYSLRRPDYNQILAWAEEQEMDPLELLKVFEETSWHIDEGYLADHWSMTTMRFEVDDGRICSLPWDFDRLSLLSPSWHPHLQIRRFGAIGQMPTHTFTWCANQYLQFFDCSHSELLALDLQDAGNLVELICASNFLGSLSLDGLASLERLDCSNNQLTRIEALVAPRLKEIDLDNNEFTHLDFASSPELERLWCGNNLLEDLRLAPFSRLKELSCENNNLSRIDISSLANLEALYCQENDILELDLSGNPLITAVWCDSDVRLLNYPEDLEIERF